MKAEIPEIVSIQIELDNSKAMEALQEVIEKVRELNSELEKSVRLGAKRPDTIVFNSYHDEIIRPIEIPDGTTNESRWVV